MHQPPTRGPARPGAIVCAACGRRGGIALQDKPPPAVVLCPRCRSPRPLTPARSDPTALLALRAA